MVHQREDPRTTDDSTKKTLLPATPAGPVLTFEPTRGGGAKNDGESPRPRLVCDIAPALNEFDAHEHTLRWAVEEHALVPAGGRQHETLRRANFARVAARAYPKATRAQLCIISDFITLVFCFDDVCDRHDATDAVEALVAAENRLVAIALGASQVDRATDTRLAIALGDVCDRIAAQPAGRAWLARFGPHFKSYVEGCRWERQLRDRRAIPSLATYAQLRPLVSCVAPSFDLSGLCCGVHGADDDDDFGAAVVERCTGAPLVAQLELMANNHVSWVNDVYGIDKELAEGTTSNLVVVLANEYGLSWDAALDRAIEMCNAELEAFEDLERTLLSASATGFGLGVTSTGDGDDRAAAARAAYVAGLKAWIRGNLDWYSETSRYNKRSGLDESQTPSRKRLLEADPAL